MAANLLRRSAIDLMHPGGVDSLARIEVRPLPDDSTTPGNTARHLARRPGQTVEWGWCGRTVEVPPRGRIPLWCSSSCRHRAWESRRANRDKQAEVRVVTRTVEVEKVVTRSVGSRFPRNLAAPRSGRASLRCSRLDLPRAGSTVATCPHRSRPSAASPTSGCEPSTRVTDAPTQSTSTASRNRIDSYSIRLATSPRSTQDSHISSGTHLWHALGVLVVGTKTLSVLGVRST